MGGPLGDKDPKSKCKKVLAELKLMVPAELKLKVPAVLKVELKMSRV